MAYTQKTKSASYGEDKLLFELKGDIGGAFVFLGDEDYMKEEASLEKVLFPIPNFGRNII